MNQPSENARVDRQDVQCQLFEQHLNECLDGRGSMSTLSSNPHLDGCDDCRVSFDIYCQFDRAGGAVLNGGARPLPLNRKKRSPITHQRWLSVASIAVAAALMIYVVTPTPDGASDHQLATIDSASNLVTETSSTEVERLDFDNDVSPNLWYMNYVNELATARSAFGDARQQPILNPFYEVGSISQRLLSSSLASPIASGRSRGWEKPWRYTSELPGIRPFHRTVNVGLVLYNDSMSLL